MHKGVAEKYRNAVTPERIASRISFLYQVAEIVEKVALPPGATLRGCAIRLANVAYSYFYDKERHTDFHGHKDGPSDAKKLAFMIKWIAKIRPFSVEYVDDSVPVSDRYYFQNMINPIYCSILARIMLREKFHLDPATDEQMLYTLHYGDFSHNILIAVYEK